MGALRDLQLDYWRSPCGFDELSQKEKRIISLFLNRGIKPPAIGYENSFILCLGDDKVIRCCANSDIHAKRQIALFNDGWPISKVYWYNEKISIMDRVFGLHLYEAKRLYPNMVLSQAVKNFELLLEKAEVEFSVFHGDLHSKNIFIGLDGSIRLIDPRLQTKFTHSQCWASDIRSLRHIIDNIFGEYKGR